MVRLTAERRGVSSLSARSGLRVRTRVTHAYRCALSTVRSLTLPAALDRRAITLSVT